jgi:hypothetical protein
MRPASRWLRLSSSCQRRSHRRRPAKFPRPCTHIPSFLHEASDQDPPFALFSEVGRILLEHADSPIMACFFYMH